MHFLKKEKKWLRTKSRRVQPAKRQPNRGASPTCRRRAARNPQILQATAREIGSDQGIPRSHLSHPHGDRVRAGGARHRGARRILEKLPPDADSRLCFAQDRYIFHVLRDQAGITFLCMANDTFGRCSTSRWSSSPATPAPTRSTVSAGKSVRYTLSWSTT